MEEMANERQRRCKARQSYTQSMLTILSLIRRLFRGMAGVLKGVEGRVMGAIEKGSGPRKNEE